MNALADAELLRQRCQFRTVRVALPAGAIRAGNDQLRWSRQMAQPRERPDRCINALERTKVGNDRQQRRVRGDVQ